jgi:2-polyprenyl-6-hydroxyphenyl methylase/3-demethylubiquinone-9 3-methyltransferase
MSRLSDADPAARPAARAAGPSLQGPAIDQEIAKFDALADAWWDPEGPLRTLHEINPLRIDYIDARTPLSGCRVLDVGCGGGILAEGLARAGAIVTGIDLAEANIAAAKRHAALSDLAIDYRCCSVEEIAADFPAAFDVVTCLEVLEHVASVSAIVRACAETLRPGGHAFFSTLNRNPKSFLLAIVAAEYILGMLPRGTHEYARFVRPSELARACRRAQLEVSELTGQHFNPIARTYHLGGNIDVNYFCHAIRRAH